MLNEKTAEAIEKHAEAGGVMLAWQQFAYSIKFNYLIKIEKRFVLLKAVFDGNDLKARGIIEFDQSIKQPCFIEFLTDIPSTSLLTEEEHQDTARLFEHQSFLGYIQRKASLEVSTADTDWLILWRIVLAKQEYIPGFVEPELSGLDMSVGLALQEKLVNYAQYWLNMNT